MTLEVCPVGLEGERDIDGGTKMGEKANLRGKKLLREGSHYGDLEDCERPLPSSPPTRGWGLNSHLISFHPLLAHTHLPLVCLYNPPSSFPLQTFPPPPNHVSPAGTPFPQLLGWMLLLLMQVIVQMPPPRGGILCPQCLTSPPSAPSAFFIVFRAFTI